MNSRSALQRDVVGVERMPLEDTGEKAMCALGVFY